MYLFQFLFPDNPTLENLEINRVYGTTQQKFANGVGCRPFKKVVDFIKMIKSRFFKLEN